MGRRGAVVSAHPLATQAGLEVMTSGGNAFDAAVAVATTIAVVEPSTNGVGGDAFYVLFEAAERRATVVQSCAPAAAAATLDRYRDGIPHHGPLAAMPPGAPAGWSYIAERYAKKPTHELFAAAIHYAREGFAATRTFCRDVTPLHSQLAHDPGCREIYVPSGELPKPGTTIKNPALARTLEVLADSGAGALFGGEIGQQLALFMRERRGLISLDDLRAHSVKLPEPLRVPYRGLEVLQAPPPSMGFALLVELGIAEHFELGSLEHAGAEAVHLLVEAKKLAYLEREQWAGDPEHVRPPLAELLSPAHLAKLAARVDRARAQPNAGPASRNGDTTYFCVVDGDGNAVSGIQSLAGPFGACMLEPVTGILLNNRMVWFHLEPGHPNVLAPRKHVRHTINPPLALEDGALRCVWGTPGGDAQPQVSLQTFTSVFDWGLDPQQAVEAPRWQHFQPGTGSYYPHVDPDMLLLESRFGPGVSDALRELGHAVVEAGPLDGPGSAAMITRDASGLLICGADPRRDGWAAAF
jgi:gamma-glutamyltranspeptidase/glutathione hydrolase